MNVLNFNKNIPTVQYLNIFITYRLFSMLFDLQHTSRSVSN